MFLIFEFYKSIFDFYKSNFKYPDTDTIWINMNIECSGLDISYPFERLSTPLKVGQVVN
jgi:hypothetical protein